MKFPTSTVYRNKLLMASLVPKFYLGTSLVLREILFRASPSGFTDLKSAMQWPQQVRSQIKFGNEGFVILSLSKDLHLFYSRHAQKKNGWISRHTRVRQAQDDRLYNMISLFTSC